MITGTLVGPDAKRFSTEPLHQIFERILSLGVALDGEGRFAQSLSRDLGTR